MRPSALSRLTTLLLLASLATAAAPARADFVALFDGPGSGGGLDIIRRNVTTTLVQALPSGVNTAAAEIDPAFSPDGTRIVFLRKDLAAGTTRVIVTELATGVSADLFDVFAETQFG